MVLLIDGVRVANLTMSSNVLKPAVLATQADFGYLTRPTVNYDDQLNFSSSYTSEYQFTSAPFYINYTGISAGPHIVTFAICDLQDALLDSAIFINNVDGIPASSSRSPSGISSAPSVTTSMQAVSSGLIASSICPTGKHLPSPVAPSSSPPASIIVSVSSSSAVMGSSMKTASFTATTSSSTTRFTSHVSASSSILDMIPSSLSSISSTTSLSSAPPVLPPSPSALIPSLVSSGAHSSQATESLSASHPSDSVSLTSHRSVVSSSPSISISPTTFSESLLKVDSTALMSGLRSSSLSTKKSPTSPLASTPPSFLSSTSSWGLSRSLPGPSSSTPLSTYQSTSSPATSENAMTTGGSTQGLSFSSILLTSTLLESMAQSQTVTTLASTQNSIEPKSSGQFETHSPSVASISKADSTKSFQRTTSNSQARTTKSRDTTVSLMSFQPPSDSMSSTKISGHMLSPQGQVTGGSATPSSIETTTSSSRFAVPSSPVRGNTNFQTASMSLEPGPMKSASPSDSGSNSVMIPFNTMIQGVSSPSVGLPFDGLQTIAVTSQLSSILVMASATTASTTPSNIPSSSHTLPTSLTDSPSSLPQIAAQDIRSSGFSSLSPLPATQAASSTPSIAPITYASSAEMVTIPTTPGGSDSASDITITPSPTSPASSDLPPATLGSNDATRSSSSSSNRDMVANPSVDHTLTIETTTLFTTAHLPVTTITVAIISTPPPPQIRSTSTVTVCPSCSDDTNTEAPSALGGLRTPYYGPKGTVSGSASPISTDEGTTTPISQSHPTDATIARDNNSVDMITSSTNLPLRGSALATSRGPDSPPMPSATSTNPSSSPDRNSSYASDPSASSTTAKIIEVSGGQDAAAQRPSKWCILAAQSIAAIFAAWPQMQVMHV